jgi:hypothetical protein
MHPTAGTLLVIVSNGAGRRVMPGGRRLLANHEEKGMRVESRRRKKVELSVRGMVWFPSGWRGWRVMVVARSAWSRRGVAPEQANAPDRGHVAC